MSGIEAIVDSLENRISKVVHKLEVLKHTNADLQRELEASQEQIEKQQQTISDWEEKYDTLKFTNTILGSDDNKRETKLKINTLIREIDYCISQLSE